MRNRKTSAYISLGICAAASVLLVFWLFTFPSFFNWFYISYHGLPENDPHVMAVYRLVIISFYSCAPFAGVSLYMLIRLLLNIIIDKVFVKPNIMYLRFISYFCYACFAITAVTGAGYFPLLIVSFAMVIVGTLLRVVKNILQCAVEIKEENDLTV